MAIPEVRFSKLPVIGSDFPPIPRPPSRENEPDDDFQDIQYAAALTGVFRGWDIGFYWANIYAEKTYVKLLSPGPAGQSVRRHARINMLGTSSNLALGNWLLKAEASWFHGLRYTNMPGTAYDRLVLGGGVEYSGFSEAIVSLEVVNRHILDYSSLLELAPDETLENESQWALRITRNFMNDTLTLNLFVSISGLEAEDGAFERLDAGYDINDAVSIEGGVVFYQSGGKGLLKNVVANDRLFAVVKYRF